jgi:hypothetical protein
VAGGAVMRWVLPLVRDWSSWRRDVADEVAARAEVRRVVVERYRRGEARISDVVAGELLGVDGGERRRGMSTGFR